VFGLQDHQELKSITQWLLPVVFRTVVFKLLVWCGAEGYVSGLQDAAAYIVHVRSKQTLHNITHFDTCVDSYCYNFCK